MVTTTLRLDKTRAIPKTSTPEKRWEIQIINKMSDIDRKIIHLSQHPIPLGQIAGVINYDRPNARPVKETTIIAAIKDICTLLNTRDRIGLAILSNKLLPTPYLRDSRKPQLAEGRNLSDVKFGDREKQMLIMLRGNMNHSEIGVELGFATSTVKGTICRIYRELDLKNGHLNDLVLAMLVENNRLDLVSKKPDNSVNHGYKSKAHFEKERAERDEAKKFKLPELTENESAIVYLVQHPITDEEIAKRLNMTLDSFNICLEQIYDKIGMDTRLELAVWGNRHLPSPYDESKEVPPLVNGVNLSKIKFDFWQTQMIKLLSEQSMTYEEISAALRTPENEVRRMFKSMFSRLGIPDDDLAPITLALLAEQRRLKLTYYRRNTMPDIVISAINFYVPPSGIKYN
jgi:DNA-binding CsgD family transcriptional regulator